MPERPERKALLKYVYRSLVFTEVIPVPARMDQNGLEVLWLSLAASQVSLPALALLGRGRGALGYGQSSPWQRPPHRTSVAGGGVALSYRHASFALLARQLATTAETTPVSWGKSSCPTTPSLPWSGHAAPGSCGSRCEPPAVSRLFLHRHPTQTGVTKSRANAAFLPIAWATAHKTTGSLEKPWSVPWCVQSLLLLLSCP